MRRASYNEKYTTSWVKDAETGLLFRLSGGRLLYSVEGVAETVADAYEAAMHGGLEMSTQALEAIEREHRLKFRGLWMTLPSVRVVLVPSGHRELQPFAIIAVLHDHSAETGLPEPVADYHSVYTEETASDAEALLKLIKLAVRAWRRDCPDEWDPEDVFDTISLTEVLTANEVPAGLPDALQAHGILHLDFDWQDPGAWDDSEDLIEDEDES